MKTVGIICEYNPLHHGHQMQINKIREQYGADCAVVCLMSGNFVQRGMPAIFDKMIRAEAAIRAGADLVLELPICTSLSSAEGFADGGVKILSLICDVLCFGTETMTEETLWNTASDLLSVSFPVFLKKALADGCSFPVARQKALEAMNPDRVAPVNPNDILGTEYCKAILKRQLSMDIFPIERKGNYHSEIINFAFPSATSIRKAIETGEEWRCGVPETVVDLFSKATVHTMERGERAIMYRLRTMNDDEFEKLPYGSEGLWRRLMHACRTESSLENIISATKTKRYTRTRIDRMILCAFLGLEQNDFQREAPYVRILAFSDRGRIILRHKSDSCIFQNVGEKVDHPYWEIENRCSDLYGLFSTVVSKSGEEKMRRVFYARETNG